jgi:hypothetical protein
LDAPDQACIRQCVERVIHGLVGDLGHVFAGSTDDRFGVGVRMRIHRAEHCDPGSSYSQGRLYQQLPEVDRGTHANKCQPVSGISQEMAGI